MGESIRVHTCRLTKLPRESAGIEENPGRSHNEKTKSQHVSDNHDNNEEFEFKVQSNTPQSMTMQMVHRRMSKLMCSCMMKM